MGDYVLMTDSGCDISAPLLEEWGVECAALTYIFDGEDTPHDNKSMELHDFYERMRKGDQAKTSAVNWARFSDMFEGALSEGKDLIYIGLSSGISTTSTVAASVADELSAKYPERKIYILDTLCASAGYGYVVHRAVQMRDAGASCDEVFEAVSALAPKMCHWFTVEDLVYLQRGGRVSKASAVAGTVLNIKPVMHVADDGKLYAVTKVRGRKRAIAAMAQKYIETALEPGTSSYFISHGDCMKDALELERQIAEATGKKCDLITNVGSVIGAHSGPGTLALFFEGDER